MSLNSDDIMGFAYPRSSRNNGNVSCEAYICGRRVNLCKDNVYIIGPDAELDSTLVNVIMELGNRHDITLINKNGSKSSIKKHQMYS